MISDTAPDKPWKEKNAGRSFKKTRQAPALSARIKDLSGTMEVPANLMNGNVATPGTIDGTVLWTRRLNGMIKGLSGLKPPLISLKRKNMSSFTGNLKKPLKHPG